MKELIQELMKQHSIGDTIVFSARVTPDYNDDEVRIMYRQELRNPRQGVITGIKVRPQGKVVEGYPSQSIDDYNPPYFQPSGEHFIMWLVRPGMINQEIEVLPEDIICDVHIGFKLPWKVFKL